MWNWVAYRLRIITYICGSVLVSTWTVVRHFTNGTNYDVVGQVGIAAQWVHGMHDGAQLGATNYLLKMPLYAAVNVLGFLSPHAKLLLLALAFNIATFVLLVFLFEKLLKLHGTQPTPFFYLAMLWLATISERVFWLDYANSRNLETVGGVLVLYLGCLLLQRGTWRRWGSFVAVGGVVFFADQLQIYAIGGGLVLYVMLRAIIRRDKRRVQQAVLVVSGIASSLVLAKVLLKAFMTLLPVSFLAAPHTTPQLSLRQLAERTLQGTLASTGRVFDVSFYASGSGPNMLRQLLNAAILLCLVGALLWYRKRAKGVAVLVLCCIAGAYAAYAASYQPLVVNTERYLIMVPILGMLLFASVVPRLRSTFMKRAGTAWGVALVASSVLIAGALAISIPNRYSKDTRITDMLSYMQQHHYPLAVSSREGITATYFSQGRATVLPTICLPSRVLVESNLFFDQAGFKEVTRQHGDIPLILPGDSVDAQNGNCDIPAIERQIGMPSRIETVPGVGTALIYPPSTIQKFHQ